MNTALGLLGNYPHRRDPREGLDRPERTWRRPKKIWEPEIKMKGEVFCGKAWPSFQALSRPFLNSLGWKPTGLVAVKMSLPCVPSIQLQDVPSREGKKGNVMGGGNFGGGRRGDLRGVREKRASGCPTHGLLLPIPIHPGPGAPDHFPQLRDHLVVREAPMGEGRKVKGTVSSLGEAS